MRDTYEDIWNAVGIINGTNPDETIIIGNHRDAWIVGGAADPNSGTAVIVELGRAFGKLLAQGWKPKRNIVLCSWDAEEYGITGSTEWVEEFVPVSDFDAGEAPHVSDRLTFASSGSRAQSYRT
jgi:N-acetylated-alpha-linked acidic dipeptidase